MRRPALMVLPIILGACTGGSGVGNDPCESRECGVVDGKDCGSCPGATEYCDAAGQCVDACVDRECGYFLGADCGSCSGATEICSQDGLCVDACANRECGEGAPGIDCGSCAPPERCNLVGLCFTDDSCPQGMVAIGDTGVCIDAFEVTNTQYVPFLEAHGNVCNDTQDRNECIRVHSTIEGYKIYFDNGWQIQPGFEQHPVVGVTLFGARVACEHWGKHLCTGEEWQLACEGPQGYAFPYGNEYEMYTCNTCTHSEGCDEEPVAVGSYPGCEGGYPGLFDMSGNVKEWVDDCHDGCCHMAGGAYGGWEYFFKCDYSSTDAASDPTQSYIATGFRCCYYLP